MVSHGDGLVDAGLGRQQALHGLPGPPHYMCYDAPSDFGGAPSSGVGRSWEQRSLAAAGWCGVATQVHDALNWWGYARNR
jgi:hypothetical protein